MQLTSRGLKFLQSRESCKLRAYLDSAGIPTIGWGTIRYLDGSLVELGDEISQEQADILLKVECAGISKKLESLLNVPLVNYQVDALISFCYNIGTQGFKTSTLLRMINSNKIIEENHFTRWNKIHKDGKLVAVKGLTNRRKMEFKLFSEGIYPKELTK